MRYLSKQSKIFESIKENVEIIILEELDLAIAESQNTRLTERISHSQESQNTRLSERISHIPENTSLSVPFLQFSIGTDYLHDNNMDDHKKDIKSYYISIIKFLYSKNNKTDITIKDISCNITYKKIPRNMLSCLRNRSMSRYIIHFNTNIILEKVGYEEVQRKRLGYMIK